MSVVSVYCIFADLGEAERIGRTVIEDGLAACINILGTCQSIYRWEGTVETATEIPAILKTTSEKADSLVARLASLHSYEVPCIAVWPIDRLLLSYADWVERNAG